jgi:hypothetical protein
MAVFQGEMLKLFNSDEVDTNAMGMAADNVVLYKYVT